MNNPTEGVFIGVGRAVEHCRVRRRLGLGGPLARGPGGASRQAGGWHSRRTVRRCY